MRLFRKRSNDGDEPVDVQTIDLEIVGEDIGDILSPLFDAMLMASAAPIIEVKNVSVYTCPQRDHFYVSTGKAGYMLRGSAELVDDFVDNIMPMWQTVAQTLEKLRHVIELHEVHSVLLQVRHHDDHDALSTAFEAKEVENREAAERFETTLNNTYDELVAALDDFVLRHVDEVEHTAIGDETHDGYVALEGEPAGA